MPLPNPAPGVYPPPPAPPTPPASLEALTMRALSAYKTSIEHRRNNDLYETRIHRSSLPGRPWLKLENEQITGSFKPRGALNRVHVLSHTRPCQAVATASTGNHALAVAHAGRVYRIPVTVFLPGNAADAKRKKLEKVGVVIRTAGEDCVEAELAARAAAEKEGMLYVSPYNDIEVVAGQSTLAYELVEQLEKVDAAARSVYVTVGGAGLLAGIAVVLKPLGWRVVACQPDHSAVMYRCVEAGRVVDVEVGETLSDGSAGGVEEGCVTLPFCNGLVDAWIVVSEEEIRAGMEMLSSEGFTVEGAAGVAVAGYLRDTERVGEGVIVVCGGNVSKR